MGNIHFLEKYICHEKHSCMANSKRFPKKTYIIVNCPIIYIKVATISCFTKKILLLGCDFAAKAIIIFFNGISLWNLQVFSTVEHLKKRIYEKKKLSFSVCLYLISIIQRQWYLHKCKTQLFKMLHVKSKGLIITIKWILWDKNFRPKR